MLLLTMTVLAGWGLSKGYETQKKAGNFEVILKAEKYPLIKGDNALSVAVLDASKKPVANAKVSIRYFMPPMPGMAPMEYPVTPAKKGDAYTFTANIPMEGGWKVEVSITSETGAEASATFNLDAR
jgi:uncharacterized GH25 family protein